MSKSETEPKRFLSKKQLKQVLMLVGILLMSLVLSGCENFVETDVSAEPKSIIQTISETANSENITEIKTIEPPEDGWTLEQLNNFIYINGVNYCYPIKLTDLGKNFSAEDNMILYKNKLSFGGSVNDDNIYNSFMFSISGNQSEIPNNMLININGVTLGTELQDLFLMLGKTEFETQDGLTRVIYNLENLIIIFILDEESKINIISISWRE